MVSFKDLTPAKFLRARLNSGDMLILRRREGAYTGFNSSQNNYNSLTFI
ncbi:protein of unknown function [Pararobbsia alpina]